MTPRQLTDGELGILTLIQAHKGPLNKPEEVSFTDDGEDSHDNALAESTIGLFKTEVVRQRRCWKSLEEVELATLEWVDWYNNRRLFGALGNMPPAEYAQAYLLSLEAPAKVVGLN